MNRRTALSLIAGFVGVPLGSRANILAAPVPHHLRLVNPHTGETFAGAYRDDRGPIVSAMTDLSVFLRDFHSSSTIEIDVGLIDFLAAVMAAVGAPTATILSAYRTPATNALLERTTFGVAENSQHLYGRALDVHFGTRLVEAMTIARSMQIGGVGWYPCSGFLHIDTGPVRNWDLYENGLGSLLFDGKRIHLHHTGDPAIDASSGRFLPGTEQSGRLTPGMEQSGRLLPEIDYRSRFSGKTLGVRK